MSSSDHNQPLPQTLESPPQSSSDSSIHTEPDKAVEEKADAVDDAQKIETSEGDKEEEEGEEGECGFCLFMKGGGCRDSFVAWENCVEEAEKTKEDVVEKCFEVTSILRKCMEAHADYYEPILRAEKAAQDEAVKELEKEKVAAEESKSNDLKGKENVEEN